MDIKTIGTKISAFFSSFKKGENEEKTKGNSPINMVLTRKQSMVALGVAAASLVAMLVYGFLTYQKHNHINQRTDELLQLSTYEIDTRGTMGTLLGEYGEHPTVHDLLAVEDEVSTNLEYYRALAVEQTTYYNMLPRYLYFPRLNIWQDPYTKVIDPTIVGQKYLELDPFQDIFLIQQWSDFFKNVGEGAERNNITSINIGNITDVDTEHFIVPIEISFTSPDKRSFLLLVNKLSTTSNSTNVALLNEFFYYLIKNIKENKQEEIEDLKKEYLPLFTGMDEESLDNDTIIGYHLYQWVKGTGENLLIDDDIINETVKENVLLCDKNTPEEQIPTCFYRFREKYRDLPYLAYTIGILNAEGKTQLLRNFLVDLAPVITISDFSFEKMYNSDIFSDQNQFYQGRIKFNAYGKSMSEEEVSGIATSLGKLCFREGEGGPVTPVSPEIALSRVNQNLISLGSGNTLQFSNVIGDLEELQQLFTNIQAEYPGLSNYKKTIRLFEVFRMLKESNLCDRDK